MTDFEAAQAKLRASQQHVLDRPAPAPADPPRTQRRLAMWVGGACIALGLAGIAHRAFGAELDHQRPHEIWFYRSGKDYREDRPNFGPIPGGPYESREACRHAILFVKVQESGVRLRCDPIDQFRVK